MTRADTTPDLFGGEPDKPRGKHYVEPRGYAAPPGTGPAGETCATCEYAMRYGRYAKCRHPWRQYKNTHGKATDIRLGSPACSRWAKMLREAK